MNLFSGFFLKKLIGALLKPPILPLLLIAAGLLLARRRPRSGQVLAWTGLALALFLSTPMTVNLLVRPLEDVPLLVLGRLAEAQAIVILAGGQRAFMPEYGGPTPNRFTLERLRYGARLVRLSHLPLLMAGGNPTARLAESRAMDAAMRQDFGIAAKWLETRSLDTAENARYSAPMLREAGVRRIVLVTHAVHMRRSINEFRAEGFEVIPAPTAFLSDSTAGEEFFDFLPSMTAAYAGWYATHEWLGLAAQWLRFRFEGEHRAGGRGSMH